MNTLTLSDQVIKAAYEVHNELGVGFLEKVFENALIITLQEMGINARAQVPIDVFYRNQKVGEYYSDILVEGQLVVELKIVKQLRGEHMAHINKLSKSDTTR